MQNAQCKMQNYGVSFGNAYRAVHKAIGNLSFPKSQKASDITVPAIQSNMEGRVRGSTRSVTHCLPVHTSIRWRISVPSVHKAIGNLSFPKPQKASDITVPAIQSSMAARGCGLTRSVTHCLPVHTGMKKLPPENREGDIFREIRPACSSSESWGSSCGLRCSCAAGPC